MNTIGRADRELEQWKLLCRCLLADLEGAKELVGDNYPNCWDVSVADARTALKIYE